MLFSTSFIWASRAFLSGSVWRYSYVSMMMRFTSFAMGSTFFTFATSRL